MNRRRLLGLIGGLGTASVIGGGVVVHRIYRDESLAPVLLQNSTSERQTVDVEIHGEDTILETTYAISAMGEKQTTVTLPDEGMYHVEASHPSGDSDQTELPLSEDRGAIVWVQDQGVELSSQ